MRKWNLGLCCLLSASVVWGDLLLGWDMNGLGGGIGALTEVVTSIVEHAQIQESSIIRRAGGMTTQGANNAFVTGGWSTTDINDALANDNFINWTVSSTAGFQFNVTNFSWRISRNTTGPTGLVLRSSLDNFSTDLAVYALTNTSQTEFQIPLSGGVMTTSVEYRVYGFGSSSALFGLQRINDGSGFGQNGIDMAIFGDVEPIPEPQGLVLLVLGCLIAWRKKLEAILPSQNRRFTEAPLHRR